MIGKAPLEIRLESREHAKRPLERVYMNITSSSIPSIEGYNYALVIVDNASMYQWVYGLKEKSEANAAVRKWKMCHSKHQSATSTADIDSRQCWRAQKCRSQRICSVIGCKELFFSGIRAISEWACRIQYYFAYDFDSNANGSVGVNWRILYRALVNAKDARNVTYHNSIKTTPYYFIHGEPTNLSKSWHSDVQHTHTSMVIAEKTATRKQWVCHIYTKLLLPTLKK